MKAETASFHNPVSVHIGVGKFELLPNILLGRRTLVITSAGNWSRHGSKLTRSLGTKLLNVHADVFPNPTISSCEEAYKLVSEAPPEVIVALGGGSVLDTGKAVAAQFAAKSSAWLRDHLQNDVGFPATFDPPRIIAIPTTAGTGSEVTPFATIWDEASHKKYSLSHSGLYPDAAIADPSLTLSLPRDQTIATALDSLSHCMEAIWNRRANPITDLLATEAISQIPTQLERVLLNNEDLPARARLQFASLLGGLAISQTRTALAHSISYPLTGQFGLVHGIACSFTLPELLRFTSAVAPDRAEIVAKALDMGVVQESIDSLYSFFDRLGIGPTLAAHVPHHDIRAVHGHLLTPGRSDNYVSPVTEDRAWELVANAFGAITGIGLP